MIKKIFATVLILNAILINVIIGLLFPSNSIDEEISKKIVDIKNSNEIINTYSNLIMEIVPANE